MSNSEARLFAYRMDKWKGPSQGVMPAYGLVGEKGKGCKGFYRDDVVATER